MLIQTAVGAAVTTSFFRRAVGLNLKKLQESRPEDKYVLFPVTFIGMTIIVAAIVDTPLRELAYQAGL